MTCNEELEKYLEKTVTRINLKSEHILEYFTFKIDRLLSNDSLVARRLVCLHDHKL